MNDNCAQILIIEFQKLNRTLETIAKLLSMIAEKQ